MAAKKKVAAKKKPTPKKAPAKKRVARKAPASQPAAAAAPVAPEKTIPKAPPRRGIQPGETVKLSSGRTVTRLEKPHHGSEEEGKKEG
jgi:hypothetical protein